MNLRLASPLVAGMALAAGLALSGCSADVTSPPAAAPVGAAVTAALPAPGAGAAVAPTATAPGAVPPVSLPSLAAGLPSDLTTDLPTAGAAMTELPKTFPLPPGASVGAAVQDGSEVAAIITVTDGVSAFDFWKAQLPAAGYTVTGANNVGGVGEITFTGHGCGAGSQIEMTGTQAAYQCKQG